MERRHLQIAVSLSSVAAAIFGLGLGVALHHGAPKVEGWANAATSTAGQANGSKISSDQGEIPKSLGARSPDFPVTTIHCQYLFTPTQADYDGQCRVEEFENGTTYSWPGHTMKWITGPMAGPWTAGSLNGEPAMRYEIDRDSPTIATTDLKTVLMLF